MIEQFNDLLSRIKPANSSLALQAKARLDNLTKPRGSLGRLEDLATFYVIATGSLQPVLEKKKIFCFAADHGVAEEGVSAFPAEVTPQMVYNMLRGGAAINVLSRHAGADLDVVDVGVNHDFSGYSSLISKKVRYGTANISAGPAMSREEALTALFAGADLAVKASQDGYHLLGTGEMGIANSASATALFSVFLSIPVEDITGRGTGIDDEKLQHKKEVIRRAVKINAGNCTTPLDTLASLGGLEIAAITGLILGSASKGVPVVVDGFISTAAAVTAIKMNAHVRDYLFFSHLSNEQGHKAVMQNLRARPILDLEMRLGEGTGAVLAMQVVEGAVRIYNDMATFSSANVSDTQQHTECHPR
jgi:nicotinate-nucleotide--dimethylbenzimidazole phosphoribosyltransferase